MLRGRDIICFSSIDWDFIWQGHQEIMATFAREGNRVLFVENTGVRPPTLRDLPRLRQRLWNWWRSIKGFRQERDNLWIYSPVVLPFPYSRLARWLNRGLILRALHRWMRAVEFHEPIVWVFLPTSLVHDLTVELNPTLTVYYCIDDFASSSNQAQRIRRSEDEIFRTVDLVFVTSHQLYQRAQQFNRQVHLFPFGVNYEHFDQVRCSADAVPHDLDAIARPIIGYVGGLHRWLDQELLTGVAQRMRSAVFVLVGPAQTDVSQLVACPNVRWVGPKPHSELPKYIKRFDVGIVPYRLSAYTANVYPTKLNEYLAMGIPVVATDLPEVRRFNAEHGEVVSVAQGVEAFAASLQEVLERFTPPEAVQQRIDVARQNSWKTRIEQMSNLIEQSLSQERHISRERWETALRSAYHSTRKRMGWAIAMTTALYLAAFHTPLVWWISRPLYVADPLRHADAIVVFAGGVGESGRAGQGYEERVQYAAQLYREGYASHLIFSSGHQYAFHEPEVMKALAVSLGVPASAILLETHARGTHDNVQFSAELLRQQRWRSAVVISSPFHMRRAAWVWHRLAPDLDRILAPVPYSRFFEHQDRIQVQHWRAILYEYAVLAYYWLRGWV